MDELNKLLVKIRKSTQVQVTYQSTSFYVVIDFIKYLIYHPRQKRRGKVITIYQELRLKLAILGTHD